MLLSKFLDPTNDFAFRRIFGTEKNKDILIHFLNDMLVFREKTPIIDVTFLKTVQDPETAAHKTSIVDILCKDEKGNQYIVEMQVAKEKGFEKRAQYYASKAYISQAHRGGQYENLKEVIFLAIADFNMFPKKSGWKSDHVILDKNSYEHDLKDFSFTFIELPKFNKAIDQLANITEKWCYFFKNAPETSETELKKLIGQDVIIERAYEELDRFHWNEEELRTYDQKEKYAWAHQASMDQKYDEGIAEGMEKGKEEGIAEGIEKGIEKERRKIILKMLAENIPVEMIAKLTNLSIEEIKKLSH
jgi:predicted transposase/invertase (TIGR01784 family)